MEVLKLEDGGPIPGHQLVMAQLRVHLLELLLDGHGVDGAGHDPSVPRLGQHVLDYGAKLKGFLYPDVSLHHSLQEQPHPVIGGLVEVFAPHLPRVRGCRPVHPVVVLAWEPGVKVFGH